MVSRTSVRRNREGELGLSLFELMIASSIFVMGIVIVLGGIVSIFHAQKIEEYRVLSNDFSLSLLEVLQHETLLRDGGVSLLTSTNSLLQNGDGSDFEVPGIPGSSYRIFAVDENGNDIELPVNDVAAEFGNVPDPLELHIVVAAPSSPGSGTLYEFYMSVIVDIL